MKFFLVIVSLVTSLSLFGQWDQIGQDVPGTAEYGEFGFQVSISDDGSTIAVGAPFANENGMNYNGMVRVYRLEGGNWVQMGSTLIGANNDEESGAALSLNEDGTILAVARPWSDDGAGSVNVYSYSNDDWTLLGNSLDGAAQGSGASVALSNNGFVVASTKGSLCYVHEYDGNDWVLSAARSANETMRASAISADGTRVMFSGQNWIHYFDEVNDVWTSTVNMMLVGDDGTNAGPSFLSMSGDGNFFAKGAEQNTDGGSNAGKVIVIDRTNEESWVYTNITGSTAQRLGKSVSLNHDGSVMSVLGTVPRIYERSGDTWSLTATLLGQASSSAAISGAGDILATGYIDFSTTEAGQVGVMRAFGNLPNTAPSITCPNDLTLNTDEGACGALVELEILFASDLEDGSIEAVQTDGLPDGSLFPVGMNEVAFTATDSQGLTATCAYTVTVTDIEAPAAVCGDVTLQLNEQGMATLALEQVLVESADNCGIDSESLSESAFSCDNLGALPVLVTVTDIHGNEGTCTSVVTIEDVIAPEIECQNLTVQLNEDGMAEVQSGELVLTYTDNCEATLEQNTYEFSCDDLGMQSITLSASDASENTTTCTAQVTVEDLIAPEMTCQNIEVELDAGGQAAITPNEVDQGSTDNCSLSLSLTTSNFNCADVGVNTVTLQGQDAAGNTATCLSEVTVVDITAPEVTCQADTIITLVPPDQYVLEDFTTSSSLMANDACTIGANLSIVQSPAPGLDLEAGNHLITFTVMDESGNEGTCSFTITVDVLDQVGETGESNWAIYPNPTSDMITIESPHHELLNVQVFDLMGREVCAKVLSTNQSLDLSHLENGEYVVAIFAGAIHKMHRLVVMR
ncbi:MAG: HYR domain-containing protein [Flavobacteriales bacterium]|nr:HYR domain-containing protein [Flavobacteriales bacterium]